MSKMLPILLALALSALAAPTSNSTSRNSTQTGASGSIAASATASGNGTSSAVTTAPQSQGALPYALTESYTAPSPTSVSLQPSPFLNGSAEVKALWSMVEAGIPVQTARVTNVSSVPTNASFGAEPPTYQPSWLVSTAQNLTFPKGFLFGSATAATQVEGAAKTDGKGPSTWDWLCHYKYPEDFVRMKFLGFNVYSFSFAWTRVFPLGSGEVNEAGLQFYDSLVDELVKNDIKPFATLFHWDSPMSGLLRYGSWADTGYSMVNEFTAYAEVIFRRFGNKIDKWVTINEPGVFCGQLAGLPYNVSYPAGVNETTAPLHCARNFLLAHASAVKVYRQLVSEGVILNGSIGFKNDDNWPLPYRPDNKDDIRAAERHAAFHIGLYSQPIYGDGEYPDVVKETYGDLLPALNETEKELVQGSADFFAIDGYRTDVSRAAPNGIDACAKNQSDPNWPICDATNTNIKYGHSFEDGWGIGPAGDIAVNWLHNTAPHLRRQLKYLTETYPTKGGIYLSEFGFAEPEEAQRETLYSITWDTRRQEYYRDYLTESLLAIHEDGIDLRGTFAWSAVDNFEWASGLGTRFGIQNVNYSSPDLTRTFKLSAYQLRDFAKQHLQA